MRNAITATFTAVFCIAILFPAMARPRARADQPALKSDSERPVKRVFKLALPAGWTRDAKLSAITRAHMAKTGFFTEHLADPDETADTGKDSVPVYQSGADSFSPAEGVLFHVTWASGLEASHHPAAVVRSELDRVKQIWCGEGERERISWSESAADQVADVRLEWKDVDTDLLTLRRSLIYVTTERRPRLVSAECILRGDVVQATRPLCERVLDTLAVTEPRRMAIVDLPGSTVGDGCEDPTSTDSDSDRAVATDVDPGTYPARRSARIGDAPTDAKTGNVLYAGDAPSKKDNTQKYFFLIGGLLLVVAIYMTTRSREGTNKNDDNDNDNKNDDNDDNDNDNDNDDSDDDESDREEES